MDDNVYDRVELAWASGLFEGEGTIGYYAASGSKGQLQMQLTMTDEDSVRRFARAVGFGKVRGPYCYKQTDKPFYKWAIWNYEQVQAVIAMLWFGLGERRKAKAGQSLKAHRADRSPSFT